MKIIILVFVLIVIGFLSYMLNRDKIKSRLREKQDNRSDYNLGLQAFNKGDYETALFFFNEICKKKNGKLFRDSYEMRKKSEQALKAQYEEQRKNDLAEIEELYHNGRYEEAFYRLEKGAFLINPSPAVAAMYEDCRSKLSTFKGIVKKREASLMYSIRGSFLCPKIWTVVLKKATGS